MRSYLIENHIDGEEFQRAGLQEQSCSSAKYRREKNVSVDCELHAAFRSAL